ncbi:helix-turn-helix domain-containing protein [Micromonospora sp. DT68]|uniref:helix-turn-helix domain-containing protein n=1 Tax=Micromonospora TaxID=1873 RepID=UPI003CE90DE6
MSGQPSTFGHLLLAHARARGVTSQEVATLLGLPIAAVRRLTGAHELHQHSASTLRALAERLDLPWPEWLATGLGQAQTAQPHDRADPTRVHAVLTAALGHGLHLSEIAQILDWTIDRVAAAVTSLTRRIRLDGTYLRRAEDTIALELNPDVLDDNTWRRLHRVLYGYGLSPDVQVLHLIYQVIRLYGPRALRPDPDMLDEAIDSGLLVWQTDDTDGAAAQLHLHPDVKYSLGITQYRYPTEEPTDSPFTGT